MPNDVKHPVYECQKSFGKLTQAQGIDELAWKISKIWSETASDVIGKHFCEFGKIQLWQHKIAPFPVKFSV